MLAGAFVGQAVSETIARYLLERGSESVVLDLRRDLVGRLLRVRMAAFDRQRVGDLLCRVGADTAMLREVVAYGSVHVVTGALMVAGGVALMLWLDPVLLGLVTLVVGVAGAGALLALARVRVAVEQARHSVGLLTADLERALGALRTVRASRGEAREHARITARASAAWRAGVRAAALDSIVGPAMELAAACRSACPGPPPRRAGRAGRAGAGRHAAGEHRLRGPAGQRRPRRARHRAGQPQ